MELDKILAISKKPGLYKLVTQSRGGFIAESLIDQKRISVSISNNVSLLSEIAIYTLGEELPLKEVFAKIFDKENGAETKICIGSEVARAPLACLWSGGHRRCEKCEIKRKTEPVGPVSSQNLSFW